MGSTRQDLRQVLVLPGLLLVLAGLILTREGRAQCYEPPTDWVPDNPGLPPGWDEPSDPGTDPRDPARWPTPRPRAHTPSMPPGGAVTPRSGGPRGARTPGGVTRRAATLTGPVVTWERWWARNRYEFFTVPDIVENVDSLFPRTPGKPQAGGQGLLDGLRNGCLETIRPYLDSDVASLRRIAAIGLGRLHDPEALPRLLSLLQENNLQVRDAVVLALGIHGSNEAKHTLFHVALGTETACRMLDQDPVPAYLRSFAEIVLALTGTPGIDPILRAIATDAQAPDDVRAVALEGLGLAGGNDTTAFLLDFLAQPRVKPELGSVAVTSLGKIGSASALSEVRARLFGCPLAIRQAAVIAVPHVAPRHDAEVVRQLHRCFSDANDLALKGFSLTSMGLVGGSLAARLLEEIAVKGPISDQPWACLGLGLALRDEPSVRATGSLETIVTRDANRSAREAAAIALGLARSREAVPVLLHALETADDPSLRGRCALALGMIGDPAGLPALRRALREDRLPEVMVEVVLALGLMRDIESAPRLAQQMVESPNVATKTMISRSLEWMGDPSVVELVLDNLADGGLDNYTKTASICLLSRILSSQTRPYVVRIAAFTNFACEYPVVRQLLNIGI
ncbi:MAG: HEAT repeat domain-containing protein [Planctomycetota bacterium]